MRCSKPLVAAALLATLAACADAPTGPAAEVAPAAGPSLAMNATSSRVVAYFPTWAGNVNTIPYGKLTHVIYAFALPTSTGGLTNVPMSGDARLTSLVTQAHAAGVKVLISVGGWNDTNDAIFGEMTASSTSRASFVSNVVTFVTNYGLDGVDIDWEFPNAGTAEATNFATLMSELGTAMHSRGKLLTAAVAATSYYGDGIVSDVFDDVDFLILMAYARSTPPHSPFSYAVEALDYWSLRGLPQSKTVLGVPFYGKNSSGANLPYRTLVRDDPQAPNADLSNGYHYNGLATMKQKTTLSLQRASGVGIWELSNDTTAAGISLLDAVHDAMNSPVPPYDYTKVVYDDALNGWNDWSWNVVRDFAATSPVYQGTRSIAVTDTVAWGGLQLNYGGGVNPATVTKLEFYIHGGTAGGQNLRVQLVDAAGSLTKVPLNSYVEGGSVAAGAWRKVSIPLSALGVTTNPIKGLVIQEGAGTPQPTFYLDYIRFLATNSAVPPYDYTKVVYDDALNDWNDWSWNVVRDFAATSPVYQGTRSIAVTDTVAWGGLQLYHGGGVDPATVTKLEFYIHGGTAGGQNLRVQLVDAAGSLIKVPLNSYVEGGSVAAGAWRKVSIPLSALGVTTSPIKRLVIQEGAGTPQPTFYLDYIRFLP